MKAKAAIFTGVEKDFEVREFDVVSAPSGYARSVLVASGICGTDIHFHRGTLSIDPPTIIGHEFVGTIDDCNEEEAAGYGLKLGDNVIADIAVPCGECKLCKNGDDANCVNMRVTNGGSIDEPPYLYGGYTEVNFTPLANLIKIPDCLDPAMVATFACPGPTAMHAFRLASQAGIRLEDKDVAVVQGLGPVGCYAVMYLKAMGVKKVYAITASENQKREVLAKRLGADDVFCLAREGLENVSERLKGENNGLGVDLCYEASGSVKAIPQGIDILRNRGVYLVPGQYSNSGSVEIAPQLITFKALHIIGSSQYSVSDVRAYLEFLCAHPELHDTVKALGNYYKIDEINCAIADAKGGNNVKTLLVR